MTNTDVTNTGDSHAAAYLYESEADAVIARETDAVIEAARRVVEQPFNHIQHEDLIALREALDAYE